MAEMKSFSSIVAPYISGLIEEKRALGFDYHTEELILLRFDQYCIKQNLRTVNLSKSFLDDWCMQSETEGRSHQKKRIGVVRQLMIYMLSLGISVYLPSNTGHREIVLPHIFTDDERQAFFHEVDIYEPTTVTRPRIRLAKEYRVLFRLIYCCGLRNSEGCGLAVEQIDLEKGVLRILNSKGNKDRLVYMAEDLTELCSSYYEYLCGELETNPKWLFPGLDPQKPLRNTSLDRAFNRFWNRTVFSAHCNNKPTVHDLRFSFVTDRLNSWSLQGTNVDVMMPYLQKYLGHKSLQESYYYYHNSKELYESIQSKDKTVDIVIPEVTDYD